ncbi:MAG: ABC transporter permease [Vicinamibacterales bacterium]
MTFRDTIGLALRNLGQAKLRTGLTMMGVSIGIASLAGMVSLGVGLEDQLVGRFTKSGMFDSVTVMSGGDRPGGLAGAGGRGRGGFGRRGFGGGRASMPAASDAPSKDVTDETIKELAALPNVRDVYPSLRLPVEVKYGTESEFQTVAGVPMGVKGEGAFQEISRGRFFASDTETACMLSLDYAKRINNADPKSLVGQELTLSYGSAAASAIAGAPPTMQRADIKCPIVGIVERETGPFPGAAGVSPLMIPLGRAKELYGESLVAAQALLRDPSGTPRRYQSAIVKVKTPQATQEVEEQIKKMGFSAFSLNDALQGAKRGFLVLDIVLSLIGSIALAVSSLGIMNTMVMSILERTREIGIMKAIGGSDGDIRRIFLIEASAIGLFGGVAGVGLGWLVGRLINIGANVYIQNQGGTPGNLFSLPFWLIGGAIGFSIAISLLAGSYPAARAAKLDPIQALRHD